MLNGLLLPEWFFILGWIFAFINTILIEELYLFRCEFILLDRSIYFNSFARLLLLDLDSIRFRPCKLVSLLYLNLIVVCFSFLHLVGLIICIRPIKLPLPSRLCLYNLWLFNLVLYPLHSSIGLEVGIIGILISYYLLHWGLVSNLAGPNQIVPVLLIVLANFVLFDFVEEMVIEGVHWVVFILI